MLPKFFVQTELNNTAKEYKKVKMLLFFSYFLKLLSFLFIFLAFKNAWYLVGFVLIYSGGILLRQLVLERTLLYEYFLVGDKIKISLANNFNKYKLLAEIPLKDIIEICKNEQPNIDNNNIIATPNDENCTKIAYKTNNNTQNLYFSPSRYTLALIESYLKANNNTIEDL